MRVQYMTSTSKNKNVSIKNTHNKIVNLMAKDTGSSCNESIVKNEVCVFN